VIRSAAIRRCVSAIGPAAAGVVFLFAVPIEASAAATFTLVNFDPPGVGYNDPTPVSPVGGNPGTTLGEQRLNAVRYAAEIWGGLLDSNVDIRIEIRSVAGCPAGGFSAIGGMARDFAGAPLPNTWYPIALANKLAGVDLCPEGGSCTAANDMNILLARECGWSLGLVPTPGSSNWVRVMLHEMAHGLGFTTSMNIFTGEKLMGLDDIYMRNLEDHSTGKLYPRMTDAERVAGNMNPDNLHWVGPSAVAASGILTDGAHPSGHVEMMAFYGAIVFGTSVYHFAGTLAPAQLMGTSTFSMHDVGLALEVMRDIGWFADAPPAWQCYPAKDLKDPQFAAVGVVQNDAFGSRTGTLRRPVMLCSAATIGTGPPPSVARHLVCYQEKDVDETDTSTVSIEDRFGTLSLKVKKPKILCVPAAISTLP
jgi:hypothetical protein